VGKRVCENGGVRSGRIRLEIFFGRRSQTVDSGNIVDFRTSHRTCSAVVERLPLYVSSLISCPSQLWNETESLIAEERLPRKPLDRA
jgi:ribosomal 50S subunit-recycling heat shock protein